MHVVYCQFNEDPIMYTLSSTRYSYITEQFMFFILVSIPICDVG